MSEAIIAKIESGAYDRKQLENLYFNAEKRGFQDVLVAAKKALKEVDIRSYRKRFEQPVRARVKALCEEIAKEHDWGEWADSKVKTGIKDGAAMTKGDLLAEYYMSYRRGAWKRSVYFVVFQEDEESEVRFKIVGLEGDDIFFDVAADAEEHFAAMIA